MSIQDPTPPCLPRRVVIAGATGFVGSAVQKALLQRGHYVTALSRRPVPNDPAEPLLQWRQANLFQLREVEHALEGAEEAVYLVHSMLPSARLSQGSFSDLDLICADNFARAAKRAGVHRITYVGGLVPHTGRLSAHLRSRLEVEQALGEHDVPLVALRAGIVFGPGGSSSEMLLHLVERLPVLVLPKWCKSLCQPTSIDDIVRVMVHVIESPTHQNACYDVGNEDVLSYSDMLRRTGRAIKKRRLFVPVPAFTPSLSLWWVSLVTSTPMSLVAPLVGSLLHDLKVRPAHDAKRYFPGPWLSFDESLQRALSARKPQKRISSRKTPSPLRARGVVSVQRLPRPAAMTAEDVAREYVHWLTHHLVWLKPFLRIEASELASAEAEPTRTVNFRLRLVGLLLLQLTFAPKRSNPERQLFYISAGALTRPTDAASPGRFEFRCVLGRRYVIAAIYDFDPRLPWALYKATQAIVHALVMSGFGRHLKRLAARPLP